MEWDRCVLNIHRTYCCSATNSNIRFARYPNTNRIITKVLSRFVFGISIVFDLDLEQLKANLFCLYMCFAKSSDT